MASKPQLHIAVFPWLAFGHMIPYLELSKSIAMKGHKISFISTPRNIQRLPKLPPQINRLISFVEIPFPKEVQSLLPQGAEATTDITTGEEMSLLKKAADALEPAIASFLESSSPDWIICDFFPYWLPDITKRLKIRSAFFGVVPATLYVYAGPPDLMMDRAADYRRTVEDFMAPPKWVGFETEVAFRWFEANWFHARTDEDEALGVVSDFYRAGKVIQGCDAVMFKQCREYEPEWLTVAEEIYQKPVIPLGLMPPQLLDDDADKDSNTKDEWLNIERWLNNHSKESVVYVALGSEVVLTQDQVTELALGLELSNVPFFWVQRNISASSSSSDSIQLPDGFEERVRGRGIVWKSWAPQLKILSHGSVGGFLTHCGWGSVVEGLAFGRALICLPFWVDTGLNARVISEKQLGVEIPRNYEDGSFVRSDVAETVKLAMGDDGEGVKIREEAKRVSLMFGDRKLHQGYLNDAVEFLETFKEG